MGIQIALTGISVKKKNKFAPQTDDGGMPFGGPAAALRQNIGYEPTGRAAQAKPPLQSPMPGSAIVPLPRVRREAEATEAGKQGVRVEVEPKIAGSTKTAELQAQKDMAFPDAQAQFEAAQRSGAQFISTDFYHRSPQSQQTGHVVRFDDGALVRANPFTQ